MSLPEGFLPIRSVAVVKRGGVSRSAEVVALARDEILVSGVEGLLPGIEIRIHFRVPLRHRDAVVDAKMVSEIPPDVPGAGPLARLRFGPIPASLDADIARVFEMQSTVTPPLNEDEDEADPDEHAAALVTGSPIWPRRLGDRFDVVASLQDDELFENSEGIDTLHGEQVLIRRLRPEKSGDAEWRERFRAVRDAARGLSHPNLIRVHACLEIGEQIFVVCEYVSGPRLTTSLARRGALEPAEAVRLARQVLAALSQVHGQGQVLGSIHPGRVRLSSGDNARVADMGAARVAPVAAIDASDRPWAYAAPEVRRGEEPDARAEVFSVGMLLYAMLLGEHPYTAAELDLLPNDPDLPPPPPADLLADAPGLLLDVLARALASDRADRFASAEEFAAALAPVLAASPAASTRKRRVLVIEDEAQVRHLIESVVRMAGHEVVSAENGVEGLEVAFLQPVDMICLDIRMPGMDGVEVCMILRGDPRTRDLPILVITGVPANEVRFMMDSVGATDFIQKPFDVPDLIERMNRLIAGT